MTSSSDNGNGEIPFISLTKNDLLLIVISFFLPPLSVYLRKGFWTKDFLINLLLTLLLGLPGLIHAVWVIYTSSNLRTGSSSLSTSSRLEQGLGSDTSKPTAEQHEEETQNEQQQPLLSQHFPLDNKIQS